MTDPEISDRSRLERSPSFPFISLKKALDRAQAMAVAHKRSSTRPAAVAETWGYSPSSSGLTQTIAALKAYGLLDDVGRGEDRRVQLSELAFRIMNDARPGAKDSAIRDAALRPKLFAEYANAWLPDRPSDAHCISELTLDRGFTAEGARLFLRAFDDNASFANLTKSDNEGSVSIETEGPASRAPASVNVECVGDIESAVSLPKASSSPDSPYKVTFTGKTIEIGARITSASEADALMGVIDALKRLLPPDLLSD